MPNITKTQIQNCREYLEITECSLRNNFINSLDINKLDENIYKITNNLRYIKGCLGDHYMGRKCDTVIESLNEIPDVCIKDYKNKINDVLFTMRVLIQFITYDIFRDETFQKIG